MIKDRSVAALSSQDQRVVKVNPIVARMRKARTTSLVGLGLMVVGVAMIVVAALVSHNKLPVFISWYMYFLPLYIVLAFGLNFFQARAWERLEKQRQIAARGDKSLLADDQPTPDLNALALPTTISQRPNGSSFWLFGGILLVTFLLGGGIAFVIFGPALFHSLQGHLFSGNITIIMFSIFTVFMLIFIGITLAAAYIGARKQITVTEDGLVQVGLLPKTRHIAWKDVKLFAIDNLYGSMGYKYPVLFEVASENEVIMWSRIRKSNARVVFFAKPAGSPQEYEKQVQGLLSLVVAKTGQPLYDLRKKSADGKAK